ncbi:hypothetical protein ACHAW5_002554 [Stephanodiscus triporus]|uniref:Uncharacterized protein n=1 Tax=Stephanodiscus triporus TaxID=2934178 RepID=A0ABD3MTD1_9STRA
MEARQQQHPQQQQQQQQGHRQIDESGRCTLHPGIQLHNLNRNGDWRVLLTACPLCVSGMPATGQPIRIRRAASPSSNMTSSASQEEEGHRQQQWGAEEAAIVPYDDGGGGDIGKKEGGGKGKKKKHNASHRKTPRRPDVEDEETKSNYTGRGHNSEDHVGSTTEEISAPVPRDLMGDDDFEEGVATLRTERSDATSHQSSSTTPPRPRARPRTPSPQSPLHRMKHLQLVGQEINGDQQGNNRGVMNDSQKNQQELLYSSADGSSTGPRSGISHGRSNYSVVDAEDAASYQGCTTAPRRPDPEDAHEFNRMYGHRHQQQAHPRTHLPSRGGYTGPQRREQTQYEQDDVSLISMSSVIRNMHMNQQHKHKEQQHQQWHQQKDQGSDANDTRSYSEVSEDTQQRSTTASKKSSNTIQKPRSSSSSSCSLSHDAIVVDKEEKTTENITKDDDGNVINTFDYDERGWCRRHPATVRLRKKKMLRGGWQVLLSQCPECCLDEIRRIQQLGSKKTTSSNSSRKSKSSSKGDGRSLGGLSSWSSTSKASSHKKKEEEEEEMEQMKNPPISQLSLVSSRSVGHDRKEGSDKYDDTRSIGTASTITMSTYTSAGGRFHNQRNYKDGNGSANSGRGGAIARVTRMPYTDTNGERGWYTGQVDSSTGAPHGIGTMNYANGVVIYESGWRNGVTVPGDAREEEPIMLVGGTTSRRQHHITPRTFQQGKPSNLSTLNEDGKSINYTYADSSALRHNSSGPRSPLPDLPQQQQQPTVVCGMSWTDLNGDDGVYTGEVNHMKNPDGMGSMRYDYGMVVEGMWRDGEFIYSEEDDSNSDNADDSGRSYEGSLPSLFSSG